MSRDLSTLLGLTPLTDPPITFEQYLNKLSENPHWAQPAPALVHRCIMEMGTEKPEDEPDPERRMFLKSLLEEDNVPSLIAFKHVAGSQYFALRPMSWLLAAASNGAQLRQMLIIEGGPGSGKDFFKDGMFRAIDKHGKAMAVHGCPEHENPLNLLKLLSTEQLAQLAEATGLGVKLWDKSKGKPGELLAMAGEPCQDCYRRIKGTIAKPVENPSLKDIKVETVRLSKRSIGISEWTPGGDSTLVQALRQAQRGIISMPDAFIAREPEPGKTDERLLLLDAVPERRLPGLSVDSEGIAAPSPLDTFLLATTNKKALKAFLDTLPDKDAFTGRSTTLDKEYNVFRVEEERAYREACEGYLTRAHFDPLALKLVATLAVVSRQTVPDEGKPFVHPIDKLRVYQGESLIIKPRPSSEWDTYWSTKMSSGYGGGYGSSYGGGYGGGFGSYGSSGYGSSGYGSSSSSSSTDKKTDEPKVELPSEGLLTRRILRAVAGPSEGQVGLDMRFMLGVISSLNSYGVNSSKHKCVNSLQVIELLRVSINNKLNSSNLTEDQQAVLKRCQKWLGGKPGAHLGGDKPELIEGEFRRLLKQMLLKVLAPDYEIRAQKLYDDYYLHATAAFLGEKFAKDKSMGNIPINNNLIDELDRLRLGKGKDGVLSEDDKKFRGGLEVLLSDARDAFIDAAGEDKEKRKAAGKTFRATWETIPELAVAIRAKLDAEVAALAEKLLTIEVTSDLTEDEQAQLQRAKQEFEGLGFCKSCVKPVLEYAKRVRVWAYKA